MQNAPWEHSAILSTALSYHLSLRVLFCLTLIGRLRQVLLYTISIPNINEIVMKSLKLGIIWSHLVLVVSNESNWHLNVYVYLQNKENGSGPDSLPTRGIFSQDSWFKNYWWTGMKLDYCACKVPVDIILTTSHIPLIRVYTIFSHTRSGFTHTSPRER